MFTSEELEESIGFPRAEVTGKVNSCVNASAPGRVLSALN